MYTYFKYDQFKSIMPELNYLKTNIQNLSVPNFPPILIDIICVCVEWGSIFHFI